VSIVSSWSRRVRVSCLAFMTPSPIRTRHQQLEIRRLN